MKIAVDLDDIKGLKDIDRKALIEKVYSELKSIE